MKVEYEATFTNIDKEETGNTLLAVSARLDKAEFLQRRTVFHLPVGHEIKGGWVGVRDEGGRINMSVKVVDGNEIKDQKESCYNLPIWIIRQ